MPAAAHTTIPLAGPIDLLIKLGHGSVTVHARDELVEAVVRLTPHEEAGDVLNRFTVELMGQTLTISGPRQDSLADLMTVRRDAVDIEVSVPTDTPTAVQTAAADVTVTGRVGATDLLTGSGQVRVEQIAGDLRARTGSGDVRLGRVAGQTRLKTGSGDVTMDAADGAVQAVFGSGSLTLGTSGDAVRSKAGSGDVRIARVGGDVDLASGSGEMELGLPAGVPVRVDAMSGSGQIRSDLPVSDAPTTSDGAIHVRTRTGSGGIRLYRAQGAPSRPSQAV